MKPLTPARYNVLLVAAAMAVTPVVAAPTAVAAPTPVAQVQPVEIAGPDDAGITIGSVLGIIALLDFVVLILKKFLNTARAR